MGGSTQPSINKALCSEEATASGEESGWTAYFEDFFATKKREERGCSLSIGAGSSMISDAASCVAWKSSAHVGSSRSCRKLSLKKRKGRVVLDDDSLEDTASSPVNSPKVRGTHVQYLVNDSTHFDSNQRKKDDNRDIDQQEKDDDCKDWAEVRRDDTEGLGFVRKTKDCTELKDRGLCIVPLSVLLNYLE